MRRGDVWTLRDERFARKARPVVIVQADDAPFDSTIICLLTTYDSSDIPTRVPVPANTTNGLKAASFVMTDKVAAVDRSELGDRLGTLSADQMKQVSAGLAQILDLVNRRT
jgi:mRNA interferase MazF